MRVKFPQILCHQEWLNLWSMPDKDPALVPNETEELKNIRKTVVDLLEKHKAAVLEIEEAMVLYAQEYTILNPPTYTATIKDVKTQINYVTAKTFWPIVGGKKKEIRIYIGKPEDYEVPPFKTELGDKLRARISKKVNPELIMEYIKKSAKEMIRESLKERRKAGEI
jgi:hypothetical protein